MKKRVFSPLADKHHIAYRVLAAIPCPPCEPLTAVAANVWRQHAMVDRTFAQTNWPVSETIELHGIVSVRRVAAC